MFAVVLGTLLASHWLLLPEDARGVARSAVFSLLSLANVHFWLHQDQGYFAADSREQPLLHLWSLGVEEQFYLVWPLILLLVGSRWRSRRFNWAAVAVAAASFLSGDLLFARDPSFVYYLLPTRAGELLVGALVATTLLHGMSRVPSRRLLNAAAASGAMLVAASLFLLSESDVFPGVRALAPTGGTAILLLAGHLGGNAVSRALAWRPMVAVGLISYSVYLWHWPLLALYRYGYGEVSGVAAPVLFSLSLVLGWASYAWIERPTRALRVSAGRAIAFGYAVPAAAMSAVALFLIYGLRMGVPLYTEPYLAQLETLRERTRPAFQFDYVCQRQRLRPRDLADKACVVGAAGGGEPRALLWGDSNAAHYIGLLASVAERADFRFRNVEIGSCPPIFADPLPFVEARRLADCRESLEMVRPVVESFPVVIVAASWTTYQARSATFLQTIQDTVKALTASGKLVVVLGKVPIVEGYDRRCPEKALTFPFLECPAPKAVLTEDIAAANRALRRFAEQEANVSYFEITPYLCTNGRCDASAPDGEPLYYDSSHLSMAASWRLGQELLASHGVPAVFLRVSGGPRHRTER
jgi:peptidoglycan/LPS O-acetylase OafA/YrhL